MRGKKVIFRVRSETRKTEEPPHLVILMRASILHLKRTCPNCSGVSQPVSQDAQASITNLHKRTLYNYSTINNRIKNTYNTSMSNNQMKTIKYGSNRTSILVPLDKGALRHCCTQACKNAFFFFLGGGFITSKRPVSQPPVTNLSGILHRV